jgi:hypothetical protein
VNRPSPQAETSNILLKILWPVCGTIGDDARPNLMKRPAAKPGGLFLSEGTFFTDKITKASFLLNEVAILPCEPRCRGILEQGQGPCGVRRSILDVPIWLQRLSP